jgi:hypothetical protein
MILLDAAAGAECPAVMAISGRVMPRVLVWFAELFIQ